MASDGVDFESLVFTSRLIQHQIKFQPCLWQDQDHWFVVLRLVSSTTTLQFNTFFFENIKENRIEEREGSNRRLLSVKSIIVIQQSWVYSNCVLAMPLRMCLWTCVSLQLTILDSVVDNYSEQMLQIKCQIKCDHSALARISIIMRSVSSRVSCGRGERTSERKCVFICGGKIEKVRQGRI